MIADRMNAAASGSLTTPPAPPREPRRALDQPVASDDRLRRATRVLLACGLGSLALYALLIAVTTGLGSAEPSYAGELSRRIPLFTREQLPRNHAEAAPRFVALLLALFGLYTVALRAASGLDSRRLALLVGGAGALFLAIQAFSPAMLSTDVYAYTMYGRILAVYHGDPYVKLEQAPDGDPYYWLTYGLPWPSWYGPLWTLLSAGLALIAGERVGLSVALFRGVASGATLLAAGLVWLGARRLDPTRALRGLVFFLWNPLVVLESGLSGHNDAVMAALLLGGVWLFLGGRRVLALGGFALSVLVKLASGLLAPLFLLVALRQLAGWRDRGVYLARAGLLGLLLTAGLFGLTRSGLSVPVAQSAGAAYFYDNNLYQLVFPLLRVALGEDPDSARVPVHFYPWWATPERAIALLAAPRPGAEVVERVRPGALLLVIAPEDNRWVRVYSPFDRRKSYVQEELLAKTERPPSANTDPVLAALETNPAAGPIGTRANQIIRFGTWLAFGLVWLLAAWRARDPRSLLTWSVIVLLGAYWLVATEIWPWYVIWALALGGLVSDTRPAGLVAVLSATVLSIYLAIPFERSAQSWLFTYRSLPAFLLPLLLFFGYQTLQSFRRKKTRGI